MYCVIQEIELKKPNKYGHSKELISEFMQMTVMGQDSSHYWYHYSEEHFERPIKKAYKISIHKSYREDGKLKKKQYSLCTINYYDFADSWVAIYDYCDNKITAIAQENEIDPNSIYNLVYSKLDPLTQAIQNEYQQTDEYITHAEHERITSLYAVNKIKFTEKYACNKERYDQIYDVFGNLMNPEKLEEVETEYQYRQEYEEKSRSYQKQYRSNYNNYYSGNGSSYANGIRSNHNPEDKEALKQFYRVLSKKFHPDANPDIDTSKQMQLLNQLKTDWGV